MTDTLTILGATGYTGRLCVAEAVRRGQPLVLAGRRREALEELARTHAGSGVELSVAVADVNDQRSLDALCADGGVLLSTVGPYAQLGKGPVDAAIDNGCHYLDVTGEVEFMTWVYRQSDRARERGVTLATGVGFDGVPGDLLATAAAAALRQPVVSARVAYHVDGMRISAGTTRSALGALRKGGAAWRGGRVAQEPAATQQWHAPFPTPPGPTMAVSAPLPEVVTLGRSVLAQEARAFFVVPAGRALSTVAGPAQRLASLLSGTPVWDLLERGVDRMPDGPSDEDRQRTRATVVAEVTAADGLSAVRWARLRDVYGTTAVGAVTAAQRIAGGRVPVGAVTPSQVFDTAELFDQLEAEVGP